MNTLMNIHEHSYVSDREHSGAIHESSRIIHDHLTGDLNTHKRNKIS